VFRYISYNLDNVERVEVVKGPASVFFGQGYPGGVINYITKQPSFVKVPNTFRYSVNDLGGQKVFADANVVLSEKAALRVIGAWEDTPGERRYEFRKNINFTPTLTLIPFDSGKVKLNLDLEYLRESFNQNDYEWIFSDFAGWKAAAVGSAKVVNSVNTPSLAYATYINNKRTATGNFSLPAYTNVERGAYYTNAAGEFIHDEEFNYTSRGAESNNAVTTLTATVDVAPVSWADVRYVFQRDNSRFDSIEGITPLRRWHSLERRGVCCRWVLPRHGYASTRPHLQSRHQRNQEQVPHRLYALQLDAELFRQRQRPHALLRPCPWIHQPDRESGLRQGYDWRIAGAG